MNKVVGGRKRHHHGRASSLDPHHRDGLSTRARMTPGPRTSAPSSDTEESENSAGLADLASCARRFGGPEDGYSILGGGHTNPPRMNTPPPNYPALAVQPVRLSGDPPKRRRRVFTAMVVAVAAVAGLDFAVDPSDSVERSVYAVVDPEWDQTPSPITEAGEIGVAAVGEASILSNDRDERSTEADADDATDESGAAESATDETNPGGDVPPASDDSESPMPATPVTDAAPPETIQSEPTPDVPDPNLPFDEATAHLDPGGSDPRARALAAYETAVPEAWRTAAPINLQLRGGSTSLSYQSGTVAVGTRQMNTWRHALYVLAHEWGHQAAFQFGTGNYLGAPPIGFPGRAILLRAEQFAECVAQSLVGYRWPNPYPRCSDAALAWTVNWLSNGPPTR